MLRRRGPVKTSNLRDGCLKTSAEKPQKSNASMFLIFCATLLQGADKQGGMTRAKVQDRVWSRPPSLHFLFKEPLRVDLPQEGRVDS